MPIKLCECGCSQLAALLHEAARLQEANRAARHDLTAAYGHPAPDMIIAPLEVPPPAWLAARDRVEQQCGCTFRKFFRNRRT